VKLLQLAKSVRLFAFGHANEPREQHSVPSQQPETTRPELQAPKKQRKDSMCIAPATKAYKAPAARTATAFAQPPTPTFAVVAPPKRFDATASDAR
tara:strand:+ start:315 stop:602 length:288 start_codon:yes stop_codon:yes gene_type:complete